MVNAQALHKRKPFLIAATVCLFLGLIQWWAYFAKAASVKEQVLEQVNGDIAKLQAQASRFDQLQNAQQQLEAVATPLLAASVEREAWARIIDELGAKLPPDFIWITRLTPLSGGAPINLLDNKQAARPDASPHDPEDSRNGEGRPEKPRSYPTHDRCAGNPRLYFDNPSQAKVIDDFVSNLQGSSLFSITDKAKVVTRRNTPDTETWAYGYTLVLPLKNPIALP